MRRRRNSVSPVHRARGDFGRTYPESPCGLHAHKRQGINRDLLRTAPSPRIRDISDEEERAKLEAEILESAEKALAEEIQLEDTILREATDIGLMSPPKSPKDVKSFFVSHASRPGGKEKTKAIALMYNFKFCRPENGSHGLELIAAVEHVCMATGHRMIKVTGVDIRAGVLDDDVDLLVIGGGDPNWYMGQLGSDGRERIRSFVFGGGGYVGICAGAYLGCPGVTSEGQGKSRLALLHSVHTTRLPRGQVNHCAIKLERSVIEPISGVSSSSVTSPPHYPTQLNLRRATHVFFVWLFAF